MISRRLLRIKILQILYSKIFNTDISIGQAEKELFHSINKTYDLYHLLLLIPIELLRIERNKIEQGKQKLRPTFEDLNPNTKFLENKLIKILSTNISLRNYVEKNKISWVNYQELLKSLHKDLSNQKFFQDYMNNKDTNFDNDKELVINIFEKEIPYFQPLESCLEELSIFWNDDLEFVNNMVIKTIKSINDSSDEQKQLMPLFKNEEDIDFTRKLFSKVIIHKDEYNELIKKHSQNWDFDRMAAMDVIIMQMAITEILEFQDIPIKVSLNEYIDISKQYSTENSNVFINGILDNIVKDLKGQNKITKTGKGLIE